MTARKARLFVVTLVVAFIFLAAIAIIELNQGYRVLFVLDIFFIASLAFSSWLTSKR